MVLYPDADPDNADWTKQTWDLPPYKSDDFLAHFPDLDLFRTLPVYKHAVRKGLIKNDKWVGGLLGKNGKMLSESQEVKNLFRQLCKQCEHSFPQYRKTLNAPSQQGVYIIRMDRSVLHVGRTLKGKGGLHQRLKNHLQGQSSFTKKFLHGRSERLRNKEYTYQYLEAKNPRLRALLEAYAVGVLCPEHLGLGD